MASPKRGSRGRTAPIPVVDTTGWYGVPQQPQRYVRRPRLLALLDDAHSYDLVLVSAPAGSGKSSLVADWVATKDQPDRIAWVTFEPEDEAIWPGLAGCLEQLGVHVPRSGLPDTGVPVDRRLLSRVAMAVAAHPTRLTIVVDGYEVVSPAVGEDLDFLLRHSGHRLQLVLVTRADPVLPTYRFRLDNSVADVRMSDLRFTDDEAAQLLTRSGVTLSRSSVHALNGRTEGWAAGLRFAASFLEHREDAEGAVAEVAGDSGNIGEYLLGEVLDAQPADVRALLLSTSVPETLRPGLTEELGGRTAGRTLARLTRANAFTEPVPDNPGFYRYHPFFRDLLRAELEYESPELMDALQRRTADWFAHEGLVAAAVSHYATINAWTEITRLVVDRLAVSDVLAKEGTSALLRTLRSLPDDLHDPAAAVVRAAIALADGDAERLGEQLALIPQELDEWGAASKSLTLTVAVLEAVAARDSVDPSRALAVAETAERAFLELGDGAGMNEHLAISTTIDLIKGVATARLGQVAKAEDLLMTAAGKATEAADQALLVECLGYLAVLAAYGGRLSRAHSLATQAVRLAEERGHSASTHPFEPHVALAWVEVERYDLRSAMAHVRLAERAHPRQNDPVARTLLAMAKARLQATQGDTGGALARVESAKERLPDHDGWLLKELHIQAAHLRVEEGEPSVALLEVEGIRDVAVAESSLVIAEAELAQGHPGAAGTSLSHVVVKGAPLSTQVAGWLLEASRQLSSGTGAAARSALQRSLRLASPEGVRRPFKEAPPEVRELLRNDAQLMRENGWLDSVSRTSSTGHGRPVVPRQRAQEGAPDLPVIETLTQKELEVLGHLAELLTTEEIATAMYVSVNTIRTHVRSILRKLGVSRRNAAVRRARDLQLLPS